MIAPVCPCQIQICQFDTDLQAKLKETSLTSLEGFRSTRAELQRIQESRWARDNPRGQLR